MEKEKCIVYNFSRGTRLYSDYYYSKNGQLDLDLQLEVKSPEPEYGSNVVIFKKNDKKYNKISSKAEINPSYPA